MNSNEQLIEEFYAAFANHNAKTMASCYHEHVRYHDPVFGTLKGKQEVVAMWEMLIERNGGHLKIEFSDVHVAGKTGSAKWSASYIYSKTGRPVVNYVETSFRFKDGLIFKQDDSYDIWDWCKQAFGWVGLVFGWMGFMEERMQRIARGELKKYRAAKAVEV
jgi:ketosteroid isomerase-like protein